MLWRSAANGPRSNSWPPDTHKFSVLRYPWPSLSTKGPKVMISPGIHSSLLIPMPAAGAWCELCLPSLMCALHATVCHSLAQVGKIQVKFGGSLCQDAAPKFREEQGLSMAIKLCLMPLSNSTWVYLGMSQSCQRAPDCQNIEGQNDITLSPPDSQLHHN